MNGVRAEGTVTGAYGSSGSSTGTGGFAGLIGSQSLVDGCSFEGAVTNATTYNVGGFVGRTEGAPVILRSCFTGRVVHEANGSGDAGGFAGDHNGGYVMDCYAIADVEAGNNRYAAGFAGNATGRITTSWCAASVEGTGINRGAFAGYAQTGYITKSYYDSGKTDLPAVGYNAAYTGITPLTSAQMLHEANFPDFDFDRTWLIDEGATYPYLQTFVVVKRGFDVWTEQAGYPEGTEPDDVVDGIPAGIRYVYNIPADATSLNDLATPFFRIVSVGGNPRAAFLSMRDGYEGVRVITELFATTELSDMADPDPAHWPHRVEYVYDAYNDVWKPANGLEYPKMFFRWRIDFERTEE